MDNYRDRQEVLARAIIDAYFVDGIITYGELEAGLRALALERFIIGLESFCSPD